MNKPEKKPAPAGTWSSPLTARALASASIRLAQPCINGDMAYWLEGRPTEKGRSVLVACDRHGLTRDLTPAPYDVRSLVHEYGGSAYLVTEGDVFFVNAKDQGIYRIEDDSIRCVYSQENTRFANLVYDRSRNRLLAVAEHHSANKEAENFLASVCLTSGTLTRVHSGADFYSSPALSADGTHLAFLSWMHPHMPWDDTSLHVGELNDRHELGGDAVISSGYAAFSPQFGPDERLYFVSDQDDWWNLYVCDDYGEARQLTHLKGELGMPHWIFGMSTYGFHDRHTIVAAYTRNGLWQLCTIDMDSGQCRDQAPWEHTAIEHLSVSSDGIVCHAASPEQVDSILRVDIEPELKTHVLRSASDFVLDPDMISRAEPISFGDPDTAYGFFYAPMNATTILPEGNKPPLIVLVHGGPTTATSSGFNPRIQFWTTRGFAVLDVNYRGSTGFGRKFRQSLHGNWGIYDVEDCVNGARYLIDGGRVHPDRIYIMGGSAGGYTVLSALTFTDFFAGGISLYGIGDLALLVNDTHKFEARYVDTLVAPFDEQLYRERSPLFAADRIRVPVLFFQGTEDKMVPPNQAETMVDALRKSGIPVGYVVMVGEGHGFRRDDSIITLMNTSLAFFLRIMGHKVPDGLSVDLYNEDWLDRALPSNGAG